MSDVIAVYLEIGTKRTFAGAIEWPGWCRSGRTEDEALQALVAYAPRYAAIVGRAKPQFHAPRDVADLKVVERLKGGSGTDFGVPGEAPGADRRPLDAAGLARLRRLLTRCWSAFDAAAATATGIELRKGPRGGGRELPKIVTHVREADEAYLVQLGARRPRARGPDEAAETDRLHLAMLEALQARAGGEPLAEPNRVKKPWTPRYSVRRSAWHLLDHAWEVEDRATAGPG
ncbi:MAG TPA: hypothetical protein VEW45_05960 [Candidatus Dormibacteraeota bacterium]|nr:hypothetical protein [Candidatus Dormibacteraeota bacterium]